MEGFVKGDVIVTKFPFSDLSTKIKRPALVISNIKGENLIICQITTKRRPDPNIIGLYQEDFELGGLKRNSFIMPSILLTLHYSNILYKIGKLNSRKMREVEDKICEIIKS